MDGENEVFKINTITKDFIEKVEILLGRGKQRSEIIEKLEWDKSPFSLVINKKRDVPIDKWELLYSVFVFENKLFSHTEGLVDIIGDLHERLMNVEAQSEVYKNTLAVLLSKKPTDLSKMLANLNDAVDEEIKRRLGELNNEQK